MHSSTTNGTQQTMLLLWNLSIVGTIGTQLAVLCREVPVIQR